MTFRWLSIVLVSFLAFSPLVAEDSTGNVPDGSVPAWPVAGTDADVQIANNSDQYNRISNGNVRVVSKIGDDLKVENTVNVDSTSANSFSGGANLTQPYQAPAGFNPYANQGEMPLMHSEMPEDDGASVLSISMTNKKSPSVQRVDTNVIEKPKSNLTEIAVDKDSDIQGQEEKDQVNSWVVASGQTLREVLQTWCDREGWDLIWNTPREYPIAASAVFKGRFLDVTSALVRNFSRAAPIPYAKFYKGNRVLVIGTTEDE